MFAATARALIRSPDASRTPETPPSSSAISRTSASVRIVAPRARAAFAIAWVMAPMPPTAWPQTPGLPFTSPKQ